MSILIPSGSGNSLFRATDQSTANFSVFCRVRKSAAASSESWALLITTTEGVSDLNGHGVYGNETDVTEGRSIHGFRFAADSLAVVPVADWSSGTAIGTMVAGQWANLAVIGYLDGGLPKLKVAFRAHPSGTLSTAVLDPHYSWNDMLIRVGAGHGGANGLGGLLSDLHFYYTAFTDDADILSQFDSQGPAHAEIYLRNSMRNKASVAEAAQDESTTDDLSIQGSGISVNEVDPVFGIQLSASGQLPSTNTAASTPNAPNTIAVASYSSSEIRLSFGTNGNGAGVNYVVEYSVQGSGVWVDGGEATSSPVTIAGLVPDTTYDTRMRAEGVGGSSGTASGPSQKTKRLLVRGYVNQAAVNKTGVSAHIWREGSGSEFAGETLATPTNQSFAASAENDPSTGVLSARIDIQLSQVGEPILRHGDTVRMILTADEAPDDLWSKIFDADVVEVD